jgi:hypothetical protein
MATNPLSRVNPGDIIPSGAWNYFVDKIAELEQRISVLEATAPGGAVSIVNFEPFFQQAIGQVLVIDGAGFMFPPEQNVVRVDDVQITAFRPNCSTIRLEFLVPNVTNVTASGKNVAISVANSNGAVSRLYKIMPAIAVVGPPPTISAVVNSVTNAAILQPGQGVTVTGTNFSTTPAENIIRLTANLPGGVTVVVPRPGETAIPVTSATATQVQFSYPTMNELTQGVITTVNLQITVGANPPASANVAVRRP